MITGFRNSITDVPGLKVGSSHDATLMSGVSVLIGDAPIIAAVDARGGGTGTRDTDTLAPSGTVDDVHAIVLSGGSAFGLSAATGVQSWLAERGIGYRVREASVPIVPGAILFDLLNGGDKRWGASPPYEALARRACDAASLEVELGSTGAGFGATTVNLRGGLGSASEVMADGTIVGALVAVNAVGSVTLGDTAVFWAAPLEHSAEFGALPWPASMPAGALEPRLKGAAGESTTLAIVATSARIDRRQALRLTIMAQTGLARAIYPVHTPLDGDVVFAVSTGATPAPEPVHGLARIGAVAANVLARAVARGVYHAARVPSAWTGPPAWQEKFASQLNPPKAP